jgi:hypothetical protein
MAAKRGAGGTAEKSAILIDFAGKNEATPTRLENCQPLAISDMPAAFEKLQAALAVPQNA